MTDAPTPELPPLPAADRIMWQYGQQIDHYSPLQMRAYAALAYAAGAASEREACAKVCDGLARGLVMQPGAVFRSADALAYEQGLGAERCSVAIRARKP